MSTNTTKVCLNIDSIVFFHLTMLKLQALHHNINPIPIQTSNTQHTSTLPNYTPQSGKLDPFQFERN